MWRDICMCWSDRDSIGRPLSKRGVHEWIIVATTVPFDSVREVPSGQESGLLIFIIVDRETRSCGSCVFNRVHNPST